MSFVKGSTSFVKIRKDSSKDYISSEKATIGEIESTNLIVSGSEIAEFKCDDQNNISAGRDPPTIYSGASGNTIIGCDAGPATMTENQSVIIGSFASQSPSNDAVIAIGSQAGQANQGTQSISIGYFAGQNNQAAQSISIGPSAGGQDQKAGAVAIGLQAGFQNQGINSVSIGTNSTNGFASANEAPDGSVNIGASSTPNGSGRLLNLGFNGNNSGITAESPAATHTLQITINGTPYKLLMVNA